VTREIDGEQVSMLASPLRIVGAPFSLRHTPPNLGQHTSDILIDVLGFTDKQVNELREKKAI